MKRSVRKIDLTIKPHRLSGQGYSVIVYVVGSVPPDAVKSEGAALN